MGNTQYGPRTERTLSNTIEVDINEEDPDSAEAEAAHEIIKCIGDEYIYAITDTEYLDDEGVDEHEVTQEEEKELISKKTKLEQSFIHKYRDIFSESLSPYRFLQTKPMRILLSDTREMWNSRLYIHKPRPIPANIRQKARTLIDKLLNQGIIRRVGENESSKYCAPSQFVPKKSGKLQFVVDFTALNKFVMRPVHGFPSSEQVMNSIKTNTTHVAILDFVNWYFQSKLAKESQLLTTFICEFGRFCFTRSPLLERPCGDLVKQNHPNSHMNVVSNWDSLASFDWKYPFTKSRMATCVVFVFIEFITCSDEGKPWTGHITNLFRAVKSTTNPSYLPHSYVSLGDSA